MLSVLVLRKIENQNQPKSEWEGQTIKKNGKSESAKIIAVSLLLNID